MPFPKPNMPNQMAPNMMPAPMTPNLQLNHPINFKNMNMNPNNIIFPMNPNLMNPNHPNNPNNPNNNSTHTKLKVQNKNLVTVIPNETDTSLKKESTEKVTTTKEGETSTPLTTPITTPTPTPTPMPTSTNVNPNPINMANYNSNNPQNLGNNLPKKSFSISITQDMIDNSTKFQPNSTRNKDMIPPNNNKFNPNQINPNQNKPSIPNNQGILINQNNPNQSIPNPPNPNNPNQTAKAI